MIKCTLHLALVVLMLAGSTLASPGKKSTTQPATRPDVYIGVKWMLLAVPDVVYPATNKNWTQMKAELANSSFKDVLGKETLLTFKVKEVGHGGNNAGDSDDQNSYWVLSEEVNNGTWKIGVICHFNEADKGLLAAVNVDDTIKAQGPVTRCELIQDSKQKWMLRVELAPARLAR